MRLLECVLFLAGAVFLVHGLVEWRSGAVMFTCAYGFVLGAYHYVTKVRCLVKQFTTKVLILCRATCVAVEKLLLTLNKHFPLSAVLEISSLLVLFKLNKSQNESTESNGAFSRARQKFSEVLG